MGWIDITTPVGFVTSYIGFGNQTTPSFALVSGTETERASRLQVYSQVAEGSGFFTGLTVVNPGETDAEVEFFTLLPDGTTVGKATFTVPANGRIGRLYRELLTAALEQVGGWAYLRSSVDVVSAALFGGINGFALANVPAENIATDFIPPAQIAAAITGRVTQDGVGVADVTVSLAGPVTQTRTTDADGRYIFGQLPPGSYTVTASRIGAQLVPAERTVELATENVDGQDFQAGGGGALRGAGFELCVALVGILGEPVVEHHRVGVGVQPGLGSPVQRRVPADHVCQLGRAAGGDPVHTAQPDW